MKLIVNGRDVSNQERFRVPSFGTVRVSTNIFKKSLNAGYEQFKVNKICFNSSGYDDIVPLFNGRPDSVKAMKDPDFRDFVENLELLAALCFCQLVSVDYSYKV